MTAFAGEWYVGAWYVVVAGQHVVEVVLVDSEGCGGVYQIELYPHCYDCYEWKGRWRVGGRRGQESYRVWSELKGHESEEGTGW